MPWRSWLSFPSLDLFHISEHPSPWNQQQLWELPMNNLDKLQAKVFDSFLTLSVYSVHSFHSFYPFIYTLSCFFAFFTLAIGDIRTVTSLGSQKHFITVFSNTLLDIGKQGHHNTLVRKKRKKKTLHFFFFLPINNLIFNFKLLLNWNIPLI